MLHKTNVKISYVDPYTVTIPLFASLVMAS